VNITVLNAGAFNVTVSNESELVVQPIAAQGMPGRDGNAASTYEHIQTIANNLWIINHNLGRRPGVHVYNNAWTEVDAEVQHFSLNQTRILFAMPFFGIAILN
jgi:hypothetical protein